MGPVLGAHFEAMGGGPGGPPHPPPFRGGASHHPSPYCWPSASLIRGGVALPPNVDLWPLYKHQTIVQALGHQIISLHHQIRIIYFHSLRLTLACSNTRSPKIINMSQNRVQVAPFGPPNRVNITQQASRSFSKPSWAKKTN